MSRYREFLEKASGLYCVLLQVLITQVVSLPSTIPARFGSKQQPPQSRLGRCRGCKTVQTTQTLGPIAIARSQVPGHSTSSLLWTRILKHRVYVPQIVSCNLPNASMGCVLFDYESQRTPFPFNASKTSEDWDLSSGVLFLPFCIPPSSSNVKNFRCNIVASIKLII